MTEQELKQQDKIKNALCDLVDRIEMQHNATVKCLVFDSEKCYQLKVTLEKTFQF